MQEDLPETDDERSLREEGARHSSLIAVHKPRVPDRFHDLQLARDVELINAAVRRELGPAPEDHVPERKRPVSRVVAKNAFAITKEDEVMKLSSIAATAALAMGVTTSQATMLGAGLDDVASSSARSAPIEAHTAATPHIPVSAKKATPALGPEYKKISTFSAFREKLIADGWLPVPNPECHDTVAGAVYDSMCKRDPNNIECRVCDLVPELHRHTSDGYNLMRYSKNGTPLGVTVYGDIEDIDAPGRWGLVPVGWDYSDSLNVILLD